MSSGGRLGLGEAWGLDFPFLIVHFSPATAQWRFHTSLGFCEGVRLETFDLTSTFGGSDSFLV
jgi:hypothetical protein